MANPAADDGEELSVPHQRGASVAIGALTALIVGAAALVLGIVPWEQAGATVAAVLAVLGLGFVYTRSLAHAAVGSRARLVAAIAMVGFAPVIGHAALRALMTPFGAYASDPREATASVLVALMCFASACSAAWWTAARPRPRLFSLVRHVGLASVAGCTALLLYAGIDAHRSPTVSHYLDELPLVASLPSGMASATFSEVRPRPSDVGEQGFALGKTCMSGMCYAHVRRDELVRTIGPPLLESSDLRLHHDSAADSIVLVANDRIIATMDAQLRHWDWTIPSASSLAASVSPPRSFMGLAMIALFGATLFIAWRRQLHRRISAIAGARDATIADNGWLLLDDGTPRRLIDPDLEAGPAVVIGHEAHSAGGYRGDRGIGALSLTRGIRRELIAKLSVEVVTADAIVLSWVLALSAPLAVAAFIGLL